MANSRAAKLAKKHPDHLPVIVETSTRDVIEGKTKFLVSKDTSCEGFREIIWKRITDTVRASTTLDAVKLWVEHEPLCGVKLMQQVYDQYKREDDFMYVRFRLDGFEHMASSKIDPGSHRPSLASIVPQQSITSQQSAIFDSKQVSVREALKHAGNDVRKMLQTHPEICALVVCEGHFGLDAPELRKKRFCVHRSVKEWGQLKPCIVAQLKEPSRLEAEHIVLLVQNRVCEDTMNVEALYRKNKSPDGFLRVTYFSAGKQNAYSGDAAVPLRQESAKECTEETAKPIESGARQSSKERESDASVRKAFEVIEEADGGCSRSKHRDSPSNVRRESLPGTVHLPDIDPDIVDDLSLVVADNSGWTLEQSREAQTWFSNDDWKRTFSAC
jgi:hypothetical protein